MADIKQAAKWMQEGKTVFRRPRTGFKWRIWLGDDGTITDTDALNEYEDTYPAPFDCKDILADDWELAE